METNSVCYPVLGVSDELFRSLADAPGRKCYSEEAAPLPGMFRKCSEYPMSSEMTGQFLNYLGIVFGEVEPRDEALKACRTISDPDKQDACRFAAYADCRRSFLDHHRRAVLRGLESCPDAARMKYEWLIQYHNAFVQELGKQYLECAIKAP